MVKHGRGEGTIYKHKDKNLWVGQISLDNGKRKTFYGKTRAEVAQRMTAAKADLAKGLTLPNERQTVGQYLESWLEMIKSELKPSSYRRYRNAAEHITTMLGKTALAKLSAQQVKVFYSQRIQSGLSSTMVHHIHAVLHHALRDARGWTWSSAMCAT